MSLVIFLDCIGFNWIVFKDRLHISGFICYFPWRYYWILGVQDPSTALFILFLVLFFLGKRTDLHFDCHLKFSWLSCKNFGKSCGFCCRCCLLCPWVYSKYTTTREYARWTGSIYRRTRWCDMIWVILLQTANLDWQKFSSLFS